MEKGARFPTVETVGYSRMSLRDMNAMYFLQIGGLHPGAAALARLSPFPSQKTFSLLSGL
jgi:hypothetical protein